MINTKSKYRIIPNDQVLERVLADSDSELECSELDSGEDGDPDSDLKPQHDSTVSDNVGVDTGVTNSGDAGPDVPQPGTSRPTTVSTAPDVIKWVKRDKKPTLLQFRGKPN